MAKKRMDRRGEEGLFHLITGEIEVCLSVEGGSYKIKITDESIERNLKFENPGSFQLIEPLIFYAISKNDIPKQINFSKKDGGLHHKQEVQEKVSLILFLVKREEEYYLVQEDELNDEELEELTGPR